jgi:NADH dehydrogenase [ubiquinone] 1 alpha subcomplex assembly factor 7
MDDPGPTHEQPAETIRAAIAADGPIRFDRFMDLALYGPGGYYERRPVGPQGDFVTSPHVHPVFAELLARALRELWTHLDRPEPFRLVEIGAGDGTLARQLREHLGDIPTRYAVIERSERALRELRDLAAVEVAPRMPADPHVVLGHELLDNLPFRLVRGGSEILVGVEKGRFVEVRAPLDDAVAGAHPGGEDEERTVPTGAVALIDELARVLVHGYALFVDYGGDHGAGGPVHGYRGHRVVEDVLARPGTADITAGVDFGALAAAAEQRGLQVFSGVTQSRALLALGFEEWMRAELAAQGVLLNDGQGMEAVRRWAGRSRASILVAPDQLGRLRWFGLAAPGLPRPSFLADADPSRLDSDSVR